MALRIYFHPYPPYLAYIFILYCLVPLLNKVYKRPLLVLYLVCLAFAWRATPPGYLPGDTMQLSTASQAVAYLESIHHLDSSSHWPNVNPVTFLDNLKTFAIAPLSFYEGKTTNFCAYSALTYIPLRYDPLGFSKFMIELYTTGESQIGKAHFKPSKAIKQEAGRSEERRVGKECRSGWSRDD